MSGRPERLDVTAEWEAQKHQAGGVKEGAWETFSRNTPESFWDVAVWRDGLWDVRSLDVADRKRIALAVLASYLAPASEAAS